MIEKSVGLASHRFAMPAAAAGLTCVFALLGGCASSSSSAPALSAATMQPPGHAAPAVSGRASFRERRTLPPEAVFEAVLLDVSRAGAPATVIGRERIAPVPGPVIDFRIPYDPAAIDARMSYSVRATITVGDQLWFTTDTATPVLTRGNGDTATLTLRPARKSSGDARTANDNAAAALTNTYWRLTRIDGRTVEPRPQQREAHLVLTEENHGTRNARALFGCNTMTGGYAIKGDLLEFSPLITTLMACVPPLDAQEDYMKRLLTAPVRWRIDGQRLYWTGGDGHTSAEFEAVYLD